MKIAGPDKIEVTDEEIKKLFLPIITHDPDNPLIDPAIEKIAETMGPESAIGLILASIRWDSPMYNVNGKVEPIKLEPYPGHFDTRLELARKQDNTKASA